MNILLIGGCGYIGSALYRHLSETYPNISTVDLEWFGNFVNRANKQVDFRHLDSEDLKGFDVVILLAAHSSVAMCEGNRFASFQNNVENFVSLLDKLDHHHKFIYASSSSVYGNTGKIIADEEYATYHASTYYDLEKKEIDLYASLSGLDYYALRFGTVCGFSPNLRTDIMLNKMYDTAVRTGKIEIYNGGVYRPILGMRDLCRAIQHIIEGPALPGIYNIASFNATVRQIAENFSAAMGGTPIVDKGTTPTYDFSINTIKFQYYFKFAYQDTVASIIQEIRKDFDTAQKSIRAKRPYVPTRPPLPLLSLNASSEVPLVGQPAARK